MPHPTRWLAIRLGAQPWLPRLAPLVVRLDKALRRLTAGRVTLLSFAGLPQVFLTVRGRRSGLPRTTPLLCTPYHGGWLVAGTNWGGPTTPQWVGNLRSAGGGEVEFRARRYAVAAEELRGPAREQAWAAMLQAWPNYAKYAERTTRTIPIFHVRPTDPDQPSSR